MNSPYKHKIKINFFGNTLEHKNYANLHHFQYLMNYNYLSPNTYYYSNDNNITFLKQRNIVFRFLNSKTLNELYLYTDRTLNNFEVYYNKNGVNVLRIGEHNNITDIENSYLLPNFIVKYGDKNIKNTDIYKPNMIRTLGANYNLFGTNELQLEKCNLVTLSTRNNYTNYPITKLSVYKHEKVTFTVKTAEQSVRYSLFGGLYDNGNNEELVYSSSESENNNTENQQTYISNVELKSFYLTVDYITNSRIQRNGSNIFITPTYTENQTLLKPLKVHRLLETRVPQSLKMNNNYVTRFYGGSNLENDDLIVRKLADDEILFTDDIINETGNTARYDIIHDFELTDEAITKPITLTYIDNSFTKKTVDINYSFIDFFREVLKNTDGFTNTLPLEQRYFIGHNNNRGEVFNIGKWIYSSDTILNTVDEYTDISKFTYLYSLFDTYKEQDDLVYLYNTMFVDMYFHIYYLLITSMQVPELKTHKYKLPSLHTMIKLIYEHHTTGKHKYLYYAFLNKFIATAVEHIITVNNGYTKQPSGHTSILYSLERLIVHSSSSDPFSIVRTSYQTNPDTVHSDLLLKNVGVGVYADYVNDLSLLHDNNSVETNANHLTNYIYKQLLLINIFSGFDETNTLDITQFEIQIKGFIKKNLLSRYFVYMKDFTFNRNGILNKFDSKEDFSIHCDYGMYIPTSETEINKINIINSEDGRLLYDFRETIGTGVA